MSGIADRMVMDRYGVYYEGGKEAGTRRKIFALLMILAWIGALTACGAAGDGQRLEPEPVQGEHSLEPEPAQQDMQQYFRQVTVRIQGAKYLGSGVIWDAAEDVLVVATAAHVAEGNSPMQVQFAQGEPVEAKLRYASDQVDVAFLEVPLERLEEQGILWQAARTDKAVCDGLAAGDALVIMGSVEEAADRAYEGSVTEPWMYLEDFGNYMLLGHAYAIPGVSGGGVFTPEGVLVGILCGGNEADEIAVLPWSVMEANSI